MASPVDFGPGFFEKFGKAYRKDEIIFCEFEPGNTFYFLLEGRVKITKISSETEKTLDVLQPGEIFGEMAILEEAPRSATTVALDDVKVLEFNKANFESLMTAKPELAIKLLKIFARRIYDQKRRLMILTLAEPEIKIADVFVMLAENMNLNLSETKDVEFKITPEEVANWCGMDKIRSNQILAHYAKQNRLVISPEKIVVNNINDFYRLVNTKRRSMMPAK
ncbi:MAG: Crp/Fnr family transcriptional regulator [Spirochaetes bacterium GWC1_27_15]|nr:MAG: Crp/Fnr family transcriptional regulator [Spirochaetes bacterium GWB1_27_13]OHD23317.1 MAG: Crp/Fnr family transcriptional regulator [Spirochaetes bacterium GWC1_27_15]